MARAAEVAADRDDNPGSFVSPIAGGVGTFAGVDSPFNKVAGVGFDGLIEAAELNAVEDEFALRRSPVQFELSSLGDPAIAEQLADRGYQLVGLENVLGISLRGYVGRPSAAGIEVRACELEEYELWVELVAEAAAHPDDQGSPSHEEFPRSAIKLAEGDLLGAGSMPYLAIRNGVAAGGGSIRIAGDIAQLTGAATAVEHRRRGVQTALLAARLRDAAAAGCEVATVTVPPGSKSQVNAERSGFNLLYARSILVKNE